MMGKEMILDDFAFLVSETDEKGIIKDLQLLQVKLEI